jgi:hypothetical protein
MTAFEFVRRAAPGAAALVSLWMAAPVSAGGPSASISTISRTMTGSWYGSGDLTISTNLCIASDSHRYQLTIVAAPLFRDHVSDSPIRFTFRDQTGTEQTAELNGQAQLSFTGTTTSTDPNCADTRPAVLEVTFPEHLLTAQQAGDYMSQFALSVQPL